jgi:hypothetical protein
MSSSALAPDGGYEQLILNDGRYKPAFAQRDNKQTMINLDKLV